VLLGVLIALAAVVCLADILHKSDREKNATVLRQLLASGSDLQAVENAFHDGKILTNAVDEVRVRSPLLRSKRNVLKASQYPKVVEYAPLYGEPWNIMVFVFYDESNQMRDFCFGGQ